MGYDEKLMDALYEASLLPLPGPGENDEKYIQAMDEVKDLMGDTLKLIGRDFFVLNPEWQTSYVDEQRAIDSEKSDFRDERNYIHSRAYLQSLIDEKPEIFDRIKLQRKYAQPPTKTQSTAL